MLSTVRKHRFFPYLFLALFSIGTTFILWLPFLLRAENWFSLSYPGLSFLEVYKHFDGPLYVVAAKSLYDPQIIEKMKIETLLPPSYFVAHLPLYPLLIRILSPIGWLQSMIAVTVLSSVLFSWVFYYVVSALKITAKPLLLTAIVLMVPRFLIVRSVGSPEPLFLACILLSLYFFERKRYFYSGLAGFFATFTKSPGILLFVAYCLVLAVRFYKDRKIDRSSLFLLLIPAGLLSVFGLYAVRHGDFWAYFNSGVSLNLFFPYSVFNATARWIDTAWLEDVLLWYAIYGFAVVSLPQTKLKGFAGFALVFFFALTLVRHRDISRYGLPLLPLVAISAERFLTSRKFLILGLLILPGIFMLSWNFMLHNLMPISDWSAYR